MKRVLVLGASGFIGRHLVEALAAAPDFTPVALLRAPAPDWPAAVEIRRADAVDAAGLAGALAGIDAAVNCIAGPAMVSATRNLCDAGAAAGGLRIVHISSMSVYGAATGLVDEGHMLDGSASPYAAAKVACETIVRAARGIDSVILRPGCVHGPRGRQWTERIGLLLRRHRLGDLGQHGDGLCNLTSVADLVSATLAALRVPASAGEAFNVSDPEPSTWNRYFIDFGRAIGATPVSRVTGRWQAVERRLLAPPLTIVERLNDRLHLGIAVPPSVTPSMARLWCQDIALDHRRVDAALAFRRVPRVEAIGQAARWFRARIGSGFEGRDAVSGRTGGSRPGGNHEVLRP